jgi:hypothetical protein
MAKTKRIFIIITIIAILLLNSYVYAGVTDVTGGSGIKVNTTVVPHYDDYQVTTDINLEKNKDYIIDFTKEDNLSKALSAMADLEGTVYYKIVVNDDKASLDKTEDSSEAIIKMVGNKQENKIVMNIINLDENKSYNLNFSYVKLYKSKLTYNSTDYEDGKILVGDPDAILNAYKGSGSVIINETRDDFYSRYFFNCKLNIIAVPTQDIEIKGTYNGFGMEISLNGVRVGAESANVKGIAKGYATGNIKNKVTIQLAFGDGNIGDVFINGMYMTLPNGTTDRAEFEVEPAKKYEINVTKSKDTSNVPKTIIWDSDKTNNSSIKDNELLKNGTIEILDIKDPNGNSVGLNNVNQDLNKNNGWASIIPGSKVILKLKPDYGYQLTSIIINEKKLIAGKEQSTFEYVMPDTNVHISGIFEKVDDKVNAKSDKVKNGTIELGGKEIDTGSVVLSVEDINLSKEQITNFEKSANGYNISSYLDISLSQVIYKGTQEDVWKNELKELNNPAKITLKLENEIDGNEVVIVHEKHDGTYEVIPTTYNSETNTITFFTTSFSNYAIASKNATLENNQKDNSINPKTGDNVIVYIVLFIIAILGIITLVIVNIKKSKKSRRH